MNKFKFHNPTALYYGQGQIEEHLVSEVTKYGKRVLLVYGGGSIKRIGLYDKVKDLLEGAGVTLFELPGIEPNPRVTTVRNGIDICRKENVELVLAVGGGSVLDASKAIAAGVKYEGDVWDFYIKKAKMQDALPLGTILTLAATGSEMNSGGVITNLETQQKLGGGSPYTFPKFSFCDPTNTFSVPQDQTVYGIVDMTCHVFEHYFNHTPNAPLQEHLCEAVLKTIVENAHAAVENPTNYEARETIMYCSTMALNGMINMGITGDWACHAIEHELSAIYDIPHGGGLAIVYPNWMKYVMDAGESKFAKLAVRVFGIESGSKSEHELALEGIAAVRRFFDSIGAPSTLGDYDIGEDRISEMARKAASAWGMDTIGNYKKLGKEDVEAILKMCLVKE